MSLQASKLGDRSLKNDVCAEIVRMLHEGEVQPGDRVSETEIAQKLGISRSPVREAFVQLAHEGLIVRKPRSGNFIATRTDQELADLQETRLLIEGYAARVVCETFDEAKERQLSQIVTSMSDVEGTSDWLTGSRLNARFHQTVVNLTANGSLLHLWKTLDSLTWLLAPWASPIDTRVQSDLVRRHQALIDALASGDPERAAGDFAEHILRATPIAGGHHSRLPLVLAAATTTR